MTTVTFSRNSLFIAVSLTVSLTACDPGLSTLEQRATKATTHQAIDGYIVNGQVYCDDVGNGQTGAAGMFTCPVNTTLISVRGGSDVGFSEVSVAGGTTFVGELQSPGTSPYVTPLTTIATKMATNNGVFSPQQYEQSQSTLTASLGIPEVNFSMNPVENLALLKANAQVHQLVSQFAATDDDYSKVTKELASILSGEATLDLSGDTNTIVSQLNQQLIVNVPEIALTPTLEAALSAELSETNTDIEASTNVTEIETAVGEAAEESSFAFSINKSAPLLAYDTDYYATTYFSLADIQDSTKYFSRYRANFPRSWSEQIFISADAFNINQSLTQAKVNVALEFKSVDDNRKLSVTLSGVELSMRKHDSSSVRINVPSGSILNARAISRQGVVTDVSLDASENHLASAEDGFKIRLYDVNNRLRNAGQEPILYEYGNYQMTVVISGVRFSIADSDNVTTASQYTVSNAAESITGHGVRGYVSRY